MVELFILKGVPTIFREATFMSTCPPRLPIRMAQAQSFLLIAFPPSIAVITLRRRYPAGFPL